MIEFSIRDTDTGETLEGTAAYTSTEWSTGPAVEHMIVSFMGAETTKRYEFRVGDMVVAFGSTGIPYDVLVRAATVWTSLGNTQYDSDKFVSKLLDEDGYKLIRLKEEDV